MASPGPDYTGTSRTSGSSTDDWSNFADLRSRVAEIAQEVAAIAERRARMAREYGEAGTAELRRTIRRQPVMSMAVALAGGALIAVILVPRFGRPSNRSPWYSWVPSMPVTRADLYDMADSIQRSAARAAYAVPGPVMPALERLVDAITRTDPRTSFGSILEKAAGWFQKAQDNAKHAVGTS